NSADIIRFWMQHWVQLIEGRMAFPVRKRRQIGHLAFLLLWLRTRRSGVCVPRVRHASLSSFQSPRAHSLLKVGRLVGCIGCNNAALSRELSQCLPFLLLLYRPSRHSRK